ncbi:MAG TPA: M20/M25/M40 family metallo-hydrolase [Actinomycetota bacterium]|nr:M20/M25/M40 family metallo-hydrolase [Actinomycetota bacterium]
MLDLQKIRDHVEGNREKYIESLKEACRIPSVSTEGASFGAMADWVQARLEALGASVARLKVGESPEALLGVIPGGGEGTLMIYDHYDVQPVDPIELWDSDPFEPVERDGRIYARGAADNKGDLVARLCALEAYRELGDELPYTIKFFIEGEEENGSTHFEKICNEYAAELASDNCVWEGGWFDFDDRPHMYYGCKGLLYVELSVQRLSGDQHSSIAVYAPSAAWDLLRAIACLKDPDGNIVIDGFHDDIVPAGPRERAMLESLPFNEDAIKANLKIDAFNAGLTGEELKHDLLFKPTANIAGLISGYTVPGASKTVLPAEAMAKIDFRLVPDQDPEDLATKLRAHLDKNGFEHVDVRVLNGENPSRSTFDTALARAVEGTAARWFSQPTAVMPFMWATGPMHPLAQGLGIPICSPPGVGRPDSNLHAPNENARIADYLDIVGFTVAYLDAYGQTVD